MIIPRTTIHLTLSHATLLTARLRSWLLRHDPIALASIAIIALLVSGGALRQALQLHSQGTPAAALPTAATLLIIATAQPRPIPTAPPVARVTAYASPNGAAFPDPIPQPAPADWIARWGNEWIEVRYSPNPVWIRAADVGAVLTDVATASDPQIHAIPPPVVPAVEPAYQVANEPPAEVAQHLFGLTDADMDQALLDHQRQQAASCDAGRIANAAYCQEVRAWLEAH